MAKGPTHHLRAWRERAGLSQADVAKVLKVRQATVSAMEADDSPSIKYAHLERLARLYGRRVGELFEAPPNL